MSVRAMSWAFRSQRVPLDRLVLLALADFSDDDGACWPGIGTLVERTGMSRRGVHAALARLQADGLLSVRERCAPGGRQTSNVYTLNLDWEPPAPVAAGAAGVASGADPDVAGMPDRAGGGCTGCTPPDPGGVHGVHGGGCTGCTPGGAPGAPLEPSEEPSEEPPCPNSRSDGEFDLQKSQPVDANAVQDDKLARWMFALILGLYPKQRPPNWAKWADVLRLMRERDGHTHREIAELFRWANRDAFWQSNVLSPAKLREQWATLWIRRQSESDAARTGARGQASPPRIDRQCAWIEGGIRCRCAGVTSVGAHVDSPWYCAEHLERVERGERGDAPPPRAAMSAQARLH